MVKCDEPGCKGTARFNEKGRPARKCSAHKNKLPGRIVDVSKKSAECEICRHNKATYGVPEEGRDDPKKVRCEAHADPWTMVDLSKRKEGRKKKDREEGEAPRYKYVQDEKNEDSTTYHSQVRWGGKQYKFGYIPDERNAALNSLAVQYVCLVEQYKCHQDPHVSHNPAQVAGVQLRLQGRLGQFNVDEVREHVAALGLLDVPQRRADAIAAAEAEAVAAAWEADQAAGAAAVTAEAAEAALYETTGNEATDADRAVAELAAAKHENAAAAAAAAERKRTAMQSLATELAEEPVIKVLAEAVDDHCHRAYPHLSVGESGHKYITCNNEKRLFRIDISWGKRRQIYFGNVRYLPIALLLRDALIRRILVLGLWERGAASLSRLITTPLQLLDALAPRLPGETVEELIQQMRELCSKMRHFEVLEAGIYKVELLVLDRRQVRYLAVAGNDTLNLGFWMTLGQARRAHRLAAAVLQPGPQPEPDGVQFLRAELEWRGLDLPAAGALATPAAAQVVAETLRLWAVFACEAEERRAEAREAIAHANTLTTPLSPQATWKAFANRFEALMRSTVELYKCVVRLAELRVVGQDADTNAVDNQLKQEAADACLRVQAAVEAMDILNRG